MAVTSSIAELVNHEPRRPIVTHLNTDTSWLISFPRPPTRSEQDKPCLRAYYHLIIDPWLDGEYITGHRWLMTIAHTVEGSYKTIDQVHALILDIERTSNTASANDTGDPDAIFVSHYLGDHFYPPTLKQVNPSVPIISISRVITEIKTWNHFHTTEIMPDLNENTPESLWQSPAPSTALPPYIRIGRIPDGGGLPELHWAQIIAYSPSAPLSPSSNNTNTQTILYSPHGIYAARFKDTAWASTHSDCLALFHGLNAAYYPGPANLGFANAEKLARMVRPRYWIPTHDGELKYSGVIGWLQTTYKGAFPDDYDIVFENGAGDDGEKGQGNSKARCVCKDMANGEAFVLV